MKTKTTVFSSSAMEPLPTTIGNDEQVTNWSEKFKAPTTRSTIVFHAKQYQDWVSSIIPSSLPTKLLTETQARNEGYDIGRFVYYLRPLKLWRWGSKWEGSMFGSLAGFKMDDKELIRNKLKLFKGGGSGSYCAFDGEINIPIIGVRNSYDGKISPWMSLTPNEVLTQRGQIRRAKGKVGLAGLGMGWAAKRILERKQVKHLTIYEQDLGIIQTFGSPLKKQFSDRLTLVNGDAYDQDWLQFDVSIWDIWEEYYDCQFDKKFLPILHQISENGKACVYWGTMAE